VKVDLRERTKDFALSVVRMFSALPKTTEAQILGRQVLRSGTSIGANYREAYRARSRAEFIAKCGDCLREIEETAYWLELLVRADVVPRTTLRLCARNAMNSRYFRHYHQTVESSSRVILTSYILLLNWLTEVKHHSLEVLDFD